MPLPFYLCKDLPDLQPDNMEIIREAMSSARVEIELAMSTAKLERRCPSVGLEPYDTRRFEECCGIVTELSQVLLYLDAAERQLELD